MKGGWLSLRILGIILLALLLLGLLPVGVETEASPRGAILRLKVGPIGRQIYPPPPKKKKKSFRRRKKAEAGEAPPAEAPRRRGGLGLSLRDLPGLLGLARGLMRRLRRSLCVRELTVHLVLGGAGGDGAVLVYGWANALLSALSPAFHSAFRVRREDVQLAVDFELEEPVWELRLAFSLRVGQIVWMIAASGSDAVRWLLRRRRQTRRTVNQAPGDTGAEESAAEQEYPEYQGTERG